MELGERFNFGHTEFVLWVLQVWLCSQYPGWCTATHCSTDIHSTHLFIHFLYLPEVLCTKHCGKQDRVFAFEKAYIWNWGVMGKTQQVFEILHAQSYLNHSYFVCEELRLKPTALHMLGKCCTTELHPQPSPSWEWDVTRDRALWNIHLQGGQRKN
jgi:hypothetical protein